MSYEIPEFTNSSKPKSKIKSKASKKLKDQKLIKFNNYIITILVLAVVIGKLSHMLHKQDQRMSQLSQQNEKLEEKVKGLEKINEGLVKNMTSAAKGHSNTRGNLSSAQGTIEGLKSQLSKTKGEIAQLQAQISALKSSQSSSQAVSQQQAQGNPSISQKERESYTNPKNGEYKKEYSKSYYKSLSKLQANSGSKNKSRRYKSTRSNYNISNPFNSVISSLNKLSKTVRNPSSGSKSKKSSLNDTSLKNFQGNNSQLVGGWGEP
jgi:chromosome segregation ATPase